MRKILAALVFLLFFPSQTLAYPYDAAPCIPWDGGDEYCQGDPLTAFEHNNIRALDWCEDVYSAGCRFFTTPEDYYCEGDFRCFNPPCTGEYPYEGYYCDFRCSNPNVEIECLASCACEEDVACVQGTCGGIEGGDQCREQHPEDCFEAGYCEGDQQAFCSYDEEESRYVCLCDDEFFDITPTMPPPDTPTLPPLSPARVYCDADGNQTDEPEERNPRLYTAIGCIPIGSNTEFARFFLGWSLGIGGGIAFILIVYAGFLIITSSGNPQRLQAGKELLYSSLTGLLLLVFSAFILRAIGVNILQIPGF